MKERIKRLAQNQFLRNVSTLAAGAVISQAIVVAVSPILSRVYSEQSFGALSVFTSIAVFFAVVSTGRYELALGLPEDKRKASAIFKLIVTIGFFISLFYLLLVFFLKNIIPIADKTGFLSSGMEYYAPLYVFLISIYSGLGYWQQRDKKYKNITVSNAVQVITTAISSVLFGFMHVHQGLIIALILGIAVSNVYLLLCEKELVLQFFKINKIGKIAKEYQSFPRYMIFSDLSLTASQQFIPVLFSALYSTGVVGFYSMANRLIRLPNIVITSAIGNVFRNDAIDEIRAKGECRALYVSTFRKLVIMSVPIYIAVFILSPTLFKVFLGDKWEVAGHYARILSVMLLFEFVALPLSTIFNIREKQKLLARFQFLNAIVGGVSIYMGSRLFQSPAVSLILFASTSIIFNVIMISFSYKYSLNA